LDEQARCSLNVCTFNRFRPIVTLARALGLLLLALAAAAGYGLYTGKIVVPDRWNPFAPLALDQPIDWLTRYKLARASRDPAQCTAILSQTQWRYSPVPDRETGPGCGFENAVRIEATSASVGEPFTLSCRSALSLALWDRHVVQPAARTHFDARVKRLEHFGSYACRNIYGRKDAPLSRHATADALDVAGFALSNGRRINVQRDWASDDADGRFLREVHAGACRVFDGVLGPAYNAAHRDHFHLERGGYRVCR
jgi:hypothetical protein